MWYKSNFDCEASKAAAAASLQTSKGQAGGHKQPLSLSSTDRTLLFPRHGSGIYIFSLYFLGDVILQTARVVALSALAPTQVLIKCRTFLDVSWKTNALLSRGIKLHQASGNWPRKLRSMQSWLGSLQSRVYYNARVCSTAALQGVGEEQWQYSLQQLQVSLRQCCIQAWAIKSTNCWALNFVNSLPRQLSLRQGRGKKRRVG